MSIEKKVTARTGAAGVLVGVVLTLVIVGFVNHHSAAAPVNGSKISVDETTTTASTAVVDSSTTTSSAPAETSTTTAAPAAATAAPAPSIDQRVTHLEQRVDTIEATTTTTTTVPPPPTTIMPQPEPLTCEGQPYSGSCP